MVTQSPQTNPHSRAYESTTMLLREQNDVACALVQDLLPLYLEGEVSSHSRDMIVEHLGRCDRCSGFLAGAQSVQLQLRRDQAQRTNAVKQDQPSQRLVASSRFLIRNFFHLLMAVGFVIAVFMLFIGIDSVRYDPIPSMFIFGSGLLGFAVLLFTGQKRQMIFSELFLVFFYTMIGLGFLFVVFAL
ncbi:MAG: zf-HC2 domain-containing protein [Chloroflexota bacterium]